MTSRAIHLLGWAFVTWALTAGAFPAFKEHIINPEAGTGLAVTVADVNNDGKPDIVGVSADDVAWYENPTWERHLISGTIRNSNVCIAAEDLDGDGIPEFALGADWQPNNTTSGGALFLLSHEEDVKQPWKVTTLVEEEPTLHRIQWADLDGNGKKELVVAPLKGKNSTGPDFKNVGVRLYALFPGKNPLETPWREEIISRDLHIVHNFSVAANEKPLQIIVASAEGLTQYSWRNAFKSFVVVNTEGRQTVPSGAGEIASTWKVAGSPNPWDNPVLINIMATIEPWHGHQAVLYLAAARPVYSAFKRVVLDDQLKGGHAIALADFDRNDSVDVLVGFREKAGSKEQPGLNIYEIHIDGKFEVTSEKHIIDDGGMATEDARAADMNGDGWPDIVAFGRATHNIKYYENLGKQ